MATGQRDQERGEILEPRAKPEQIQTQHHGAPVNSARSRRAMIGDVAKIAASIALAAPLAGWTTALRGEWLASAKVPLGRAAARVGELALGTLYEANTLEAYLRAG